MLRRLDQVGAARFATVTVLVYFGLAVAAYLPTWPGDPSRLPGGYIGGDAIQQSWFLGWAAWALVHGHNIFFTTRMYYPSGANLAINTEMPLLGLVTAPLSLLVSPIASFNLLLYLAFPLSASAMYFTLRRWTASNVASAVGGLIYGFSAYVVGEAAGHLNLSFVPLPPLVLLALVEVLLDQRGNARTWGVALGLLAAAQFLVSPEVLTTTGIMAACGLVVVGISRRSQIDKSRVDHALRALVPAVVIFAVIVAYPVYMMLAGPERFHGPVQGLANPFRVDLLGPVVPTSAQRFAPGGAIALGDKFTGGFYPENGSYLGIPLALLAVWSVVVHRRNRWVVLAAVLAVIGFVWSLGPYLVVDTHLTSVPLPFDVLGRLPLLQNILPSRFSLYEVMFVAVVIAFAIAASLRAVDGGVAPIGAHGAAPARRHDGAVRRGRVPVAGVLVGVLAVATAISLVPRWPISTSETSLGLPSYFTSRVVDQIPYNGVVLTYPFSVSPWNQAMLWQEVDHFRFTIVGGYALEPQANGTVSPWPPQLAPLDVQELLGYEEAGPYPGYLLATAPPVGGRLIRDFRLYVRRYHVGTVVFDPIGADPAVVLHVLSRAFGPPSATEGGVDLWFGVQKLVAVRRG